jgi:hypothetical protein
MSKFTQEDIERMVMDIDNIEEEDIDEEELWGNCEKEREEEMKKMKPDILIAVHINKEGKVETSELLACFHVGEDKYGWDEEIDTYALEYQGLSRQKGIKPNTLYHVYMHVHSYRCSYEYDEWETEHYYLQIIPVIENYEEYLVKEEEYKEQQELAKGNQQLPDIITEGEFDDEGDMCYYSTTTINITYNDIKRMVQLIAPQDIQLAHRIYNGWGILDMLGEYYDSDIAEAEKKRIGFKNFLKSNYFRSESEKIKYTKDGYKFPKTWRYDAFTITHEDVDNIPVEWLTDKRQEDIVKELYEAKKVAQRLLDAKGNNKRHIDVVNG